MIIAVNPDLRRGERAARECAVPARESAAPAASTSAASARNASGKFGNFFCRSAKALRSEARIDWINGTLRHAH